MSVDPIGSAAIALGTQVVKSACQLWLGDGAASDLSATAADLLAGRITDAIEHRRLSRMFEGFAVAVADKTRRTDDPRFRQLPDNEREAAILAVAETFARAEMDDQALFAANLDARYLEKHLRSHLGGRDRAWGLSDEGTAFYDLLLRESCAYLLEITTALPRFTARALTEILRRESAIERQVADLLERLPARISMSGDAGFETDYRRQVAKELDFMDLFGATVFEQNRGYQLSVAYISLAVVDARAAAARNASPTRERDPLMLPARTNGQAAMAGDPNALQGVAVETALIDSRRVFIRGEAGSGKTTLLQWLAVSTARRVFTGQQAEWNELVPFFIRLRRFAGSGSLPRPEQFLDNDVAVSLAAEMPPGWVHRLLEEGRAVVLVDGVDEVPKARRHDVQEWLRGLVAAFPKSRYVVTSRPAAAPSGWLDRQDFDAYVVQPMTLPDVRQFIAHWHDAVGRTLVDTAARQTLTGLSTALTEKILDRRHLRQLATSPLMCALLCALNRERHTQLPDNRIELFRISLEMFLDRRDIERGLPPGPAVLDYTDKQHLLQDLAYWMMTNALPEAERQRVLDRLDARLRTRRHRVSGTSGEVLEYLLERSGLIREPIVGRVDFVHRSFQEFLAAQAAVDADHIEALVERAPDDQWRQVVILAAGLATARQSEQLFAGLLHPPRRLRQPQTQMLLDLTALGCMETATDVDVAVTDEVRRRASELIPPRDMDRVIALGRAGEFAFELLAGAVIEDRNAAIYSTRLAANLAGSHGLQFIEKVARNHELLPASVLVSYWDEFDPAEYAERVLSGWDIKSVNIVDPQLIPGIVQLETIEALGCRCGPWCDFGFLGRMPALRYAGIFIDHNHGPLRVTLPPSAESLLISAASTWSRPTGAASSDSPVVWAIRRPRGQAKPTLRIESLDGGRVLDSLALVGEVERVVIGADQRLTDLTGLVLPEGVTALEIDSCRKLRSLDGAERFIGTRLNELHVLGLRSRLSGLEPLLRPDPSYGGRRLVDQLRMIRISYVDITEAEVGDPMADLAPYGFHFQVNTRITALIEITATKPE